MKKDGMKKEHKKMTKSTRIFVAVLVVVVVLIIGLVVGNIIVRINHDRKNDESSQQEQNTDDNQSNNKEDDEEDYIDVEIAPIDKNTYKRKIAVEIADMEDQRDVAALIAIYQKYIDAFRDEIKDEEIVKELYNERIFTILKMDPDGAYGNEVIADAIKLDDMLQTISSAAQVYNYASAYGRQDLMDKYEKILNDRAAEAGLNIDDDSEIVNIKVSSKTPLKNDKNE